MELELGLALPCSDSLKTMRGFDLNGGMHINTPNSASSRKRGFMEVFGAAEDPTILTLLARGDGSGKNAEESKYEFQDYPIKMKKALVGWPPVKRPRGGGKCVKVKMEGVGIGRKVDLSLHNSYQSLRRTLAIMFPKEQDENFTDTNYTKNQFTITYEDEDGDWLLVGDVPWQNFIQSVKRLKILR